MIFMTVQNEQELQGLKQNICPFNWMCMVRQQLKLLLRVLEYMNGNLNACEKTTPDNPINTSCSFHNIFPHTLTISQQTQ